MADAVLEERVISKTEASAGQLLQLCVPKGSRRVRFIPNLSELTALLKCTHMIIIIIIMMMMMMMMMMGIMIVFLDHLSMSNMLNRRAEQNASTKYKTHAYKTPKNSMCPNNHAQTSNLAVKMGKKKKIYVSIKRRNCINAHIVIPTIQTSYELCLIKQTINLTLMSI